VLADHTLSLLGEVARERQLPLIASLHAVDLALKHFPRIVGLRAGKVLFDKPADEVSEQDLTALYANSTLSAGTPRPLPGDPARPVRCL
jgi:phosphonate transport system ATP-binding protein